MRSAILGGSFNPVHNGHLSLAEAVHDIGYDRILFIPAADPPHKRLSSGASDDQRIEMIKIAIEGLDWARIWDGEIRRGGISYTIDTIRELKETGFIEGKPGLILGDDLAAGFESWNNAQSLAEEADIILARRGKDDVDFSYPCKRLGNGLWPNSSTEARRRLSEGRDLEELVPHRVAEYIKRNGLYGGD